MQQWSRAVVGDDVRAQFSAAANAALFAPDPEAAERFDHAALMAAVRLSTILKSDVSLIATRAAAVAAHAARQHQRLRQSHQQAQCENLADRLRRDGLTPEIVAAIVAVG